MSIQTDKYKALRTKSKTTLINLAKKYNFPVPKTLNSLSTFGKRLSNFIEKVQYQDYGSGIPEIKTPTGLYKQYLKASGLHDTSQARQNFSDIKEYSKIAKQINRELSNPRTIEYIDPLDLQELKDLVGNKTTVKDFINNVPKGMLKNSPSSKIEELKKKTDISTLDELIKRTTSDLSETQVKKLRDSFEGKSYGQRFAINQRLMSEYYQEYTNRKMQGKRFDSYQIISRILRS